MPPATLAWIDMMERQMPGFAIQPLAPNQWDAAWRLRLRALQNHPDAFGQPYANAVTMDPDRVRETIATFWTGGDNRVFLAVAPDGTIAGMIGIVREQRATEDHRASIWGVYVAPEARGQHLIDRLLAAAIAWARSLDGVLQIQLGVNPANLTAIRAYEQAGFRLTGRTPRARILDGNPIDHDWMILMLD